MGAVQICDYASLTLVLVESVVNYLKNCIRFEVFCCTTEGASVIKFEGCCMSSSGLTLTNFSVHHRL